MKPKQGDSTRWAWKARRVTKREYPTHGVLTNDGALKGSTSTDYFHFDCPKCGQHQPGLDTEFLGLRDDSGEMDPNARTILIGLHCPNCKMVDLLKIPCLETVDYQPRRV